MIDVLVPDEQEGTKAVVRAWLKQVGDRVEVNDPLVELETDKVAMEVPAPAAGVLREILLHTDADAVPGAVLGRIAPTAEVGGREPKPFRPSVEAGAPSRTEKSAGPRLRSGRTAAERETRLSPSVKRAVLQHDIDPGADRGHGPGRADHPRRRRPRGRGRRRGSAAGRRRDPGRRPATSARTSSPHDRMRLAIAENMLALGHPGAARHRGVRGRFQRDHRPSRGAQGGLREEGRRSSPTPPISSPRRPRR